MVLCEQTTRDRHRMPKTFGRKFIVNLGASRPNAVLSSHNV